MERVIERCGGLDVHKKTVVACVRLPDASGERTQHVRTFATTTADLLALRDWLGRLASRTSPWRAPGCTGRVMSLRLTAQNESALYYPRGGGVQVAIGFGASELAWKMTRVVARHRTLLRPPTREARWGNSHD